MRQETARAKDAATLLEKKAKVTDIDAHWEGNYDGLLDYWDDTSAETTAFALKLLIRQDRGERAAAEGGGVAGRTPRRRLLVLDQADGDGDPGADRLPGAERRAGEHLRRGSAGERRKRGQAALWAGRWLCAALEDPGSGGAGGQRRTSDDSQERQRNYVLVGGERVVLGGPAALPARQAGAEHHARLLRAAKAAGQAD